MKTYKYLIIGGGIAADSAAKTLRKYNREAEIALITKESVPPYNRPALSKQLWQGKDIDSIWLKTDTKNIDILTNETVINLNPARKQVQTQSGSIYGYEKLLLATGGTPVQFPFGDEVIYYRSLQDYEELLQRSQNSQHITVIGGSFIGSEITAALVNQNKKVTMIFPEDHIGSQIFPSGLAESIDSNYREKGVTILSNELVKDIQQAGQKYKIITTNHQIETDLVVAGIGINPNTDLAEKAGIHTDNGILVNQYLQTSQPDIFAAGDAARFAHRILQKSIRYEHEDNAVKSGQIAAQNMMGKQKSYDEYLSYFYSDLFDDGYEAVGEISNQYEMIEIWKEPWKKGIIYYQNNNMISGVLLWNVWGKLGEAREVINQSLTHSFDKPELSSAIPID